MKKLLMIAVIALIAVSCDKNQKAVKNLDGNWKVTSYLVKSDEFSFDAVTFGLDVEMSFDNCKLKDDEFCMVTLTAKEDDETTKETTLYRVIEDGKVLEFKDQDGQISKMEIIELTNSNAEFLQTEADGSIRTKLEKL